MKYRYLGKSGLAVATVGLGTATFGQSGWGCDEHTAMAILDTYAGQGGNFIDTADKYGDRPGIAEGIIGRWLAGKRRDDFVVASKCFFETSPDINARGLSRKHIIRACEASLERLGTDYLDLFQMHVPDPFTPLDETLSTLDQLVRQGKVRYAGCSNFPAWQVVKAHGVAERAGLTRFISGQYLYNLLKRDVEAEVLPACADSGMGLLCWSPLSGGMLTGKYTDATHPPQQTRIAERPEVSADRYAQWVKNSHGVVQCLATVAERNRVTPAVVALAWLLRDVRVAAVLVGTRRPDQIEELCQAGEWSVPDEDWADLNSASRVKHPYPHDIYDYLDPATASNWFNRIW